mmetsp:Transcript_748/g.812  ORF Transcript_748/g.812 Transcript_748/m.812 type:complete len:109 (-) Transcript_748:24-350(-)
MYHHFHLLIVGYLIQHQKRNYLFKVSQEDMYVQVKLEKVPFYQWPEWVEKYFKHFHDNYQMKKRSLKKILVDSSSFARKEKEQNMNIHEERSRCKLLRMALCDDYLAF